LSIDKVPVLFLFVFMQTIEALKTFLDKPGLEQPLIRTLLGHGAVDFCLKGGIRHGVLHEVYAAISHEAAATGFVSGLAMRVSANKHMLWIRQDFSASEFGELSPIGLLELGLNPARIVLLSVTNAHDGLRAAHDALSCAALGAVVIEVLGNPKILDLVASRRLTLAAAQSSVTVFLLRLSAEPCASTAETRWLVQAAASQTQNDDWGYPAFDVSLVRNRHGKTGHWFMEWNCDGRIFQNAATNHSTVVSTATN
jgi:protein ImuA